MTYQIVCNYLFLDVVKNTRKTFLKINQIIIINLMAILNFALSVVLRVHFCYFTIKRFMFCIGLPQ